MPSYWLRRIEGDQVTDTVVMPNPSTAIVSALLATDQPSFADAVAAIRGFGLYGQLVGGTAHVLVQHADDLANDLRAELATPNGILRLVWQKLRAKYE